MTWNPLDTYNFANLANSATVPAPTSSASPSTGQAWTDVRGGLYSISSGVLVGGLDSVDAAQFKRDFLVSGSSADAVNQRIVVTTATNSTNVSLFVMVRYQRAGNVGNCYLLNLPLVSNATPIQMYTLQGSGNSPTAIGPAQNFQYTAGHSYSIDFAATGSNPTTLTATITDLTVAGTVTYTVQDSTANLQNAGAVGVVPSSTGDYSQKIYVSSIATYQSGSAALSIGGLVASSTNSGISLSAALSGGTGTGYSYKVFRGTDPNFTAGAGTLLATASSMPYTDSTALPGVQYFYGVVGSDSSSTSIAAVPAGVASWSPSYTPYVSAQMQTAPLAIVFIGDSITYGAGVSNYGTVSSPTMPYFCMAKLQRQFGMRAVSGSNQGHSGHTLTDYAPGGSDYSSAKSAMQALLSASPSAVPVFSIMLGTNDSASSGTNNSPTGTLSPANYTAKLSALIAQLLVDFPGCKVFAHASPYYTPNTHNAAVYEQAGLSALWSYRAALIASVQSFAGSYAGQVFIGDMLAWQYFAVNYTAELQPDTSGPNGTFYLHPAGTAGSNGLIGTQSLGELHASAIARQLYFVATPLKVYGFS